MKTKSKEAGSIWSSISEARNKKNKFYNMEKTTERKTKYKKIEIISPMFGKKISRNFDKSDTMTKTSTGNAKATVTDNDYFEECLDNSSSKKCNNSESKKNGELFRNEKKANDDFDAQEYDSEHLFEQHQKPEKDTTENCSENLDTTEHDNDQEDCQETRKRKKTLFD